MTLSSHSQKYYDSNDLKYFIDFTNRKANLKFQDLKINGPIEEFISHYGNRYTVNTRDSTLATQQSDKRNKYLSYLILKGEYREVQNLAKWEYTNKKLEVLASDRIFSGYFNDYFNFVDEVEYQKLSSDRLIGNYLNDANLLGEYKIKVYRDNGINFLILTLLVRLSSIERELLLRLIFQHLQDLLVSYDSQLNANVEFVKKRNNSRQY